MGQAVHWMLSHLLLYLILILILMSKCLILTYRRETEARRVSLPQVSQLTRVRAPALCPGLLCDSAIVPLSFPPVSLLSTCPHSPRQAATARLCWFPALRLYLMSVKSESRSVSPALALLLLQNSTPLGSPRGWKK